MEYLLILPFVLAYFLKGINRVRPNEVGLIESRGKYSKFLNPGTYFIPLFIKNLITVTTQDKKIEVPISITTSDEIICNTVVKVIFYVEPTEKNVRKYFLVGSGFIEDIIISATNDIIGEIPYKEIAEKREIICEFITKKVRKKCDNSGMKIRTIDLSDIIPPEEIQKANTKIISKQREEEASKIEAETIKIKATARKQSDKEISDNKINLIKKETQVKISEKEKVKDREQEIAQLLAETLGNDLKKKKEQMDKLYENVEKESLAKVLSDE